MVLGVLLAATSLWSLYDPAAMISEYSHILLGVLTFVSPWVFGFTDVRVAAYSTWVLGIVAAVVGLAAIPEAKRAHEPITQ